MTKGNKSSKALKLEEYLPYRLSVTSNQVSNLIASLYQSRFGLTIWEWRVLAILGAVGECTAQQAADRAAMDKMTVSRAVSKLLARQLISRKPSSNDRRARILALTASGRAIHDEIAPLAQEQQAYLLEELDQEQRRHLYSILQKLEKKAEKMNSAS